MAWNGTGTFSRTNGVNTGTTVWQQDEAGAVDIEADRHDTHDQDLATGINACLAKNGENAMTGNLDLGSNDIVSVGDITATNLASDASGILVKHASADDPLVALQDNAATTLARLIHTGGSVLTLESLEHGIPIRIRGEDAGGTAQVGFIFDPDTGVAFNGGTATAPPTYSVTNPSTDRTYDADATTVNELANVLSTLIADLQAIGLLS